MLSEIPLWKTFFWFIEFTVSTTWAGFRIYHILASETYHCCTDFGTSGPVFVTTYALTYVSSNRQSKYYVCCCYCSKSSRKKIFFEECWVDMFWPFWIFFIRLLKPLLLTRLDTFGLTPSKWTVTSVYHPHSPHPCYTKLVSHFKIF